VPAHQRAEDLRGQLAQQVLGARRPRHAGASPCAISGHTSSPPPDAPPWRSPG
jgi:hypothetical protein